MIEEKDKSMYTDESDISSDENIENEDEVTDNEISPIEIDDDETFHDDVIEIDDDDLEDIEFTKPITEDAINDDEIVFSKHRIQGKHKLKYDSIFKGKKEDPLTEENIELSTYNDKFEVDKSSHYWSESIDNENYIKDKRIKEKVYEVLSQHTDISFLNNRRKPSKVDFNEYYSLLKTHLKNESFTNIELFNELSVYFSDNLFNMFKLLNKNWRNIVLSELQDHIGKQNYSNDVMNRNIYEGTEIEFLSDDHTLLIRDKIHITGVVIETDYTDSMYKVNSYEKIYDVHITDITKILNNTKFKYNLNKLNNIDFL
jgi:hypothetical protein